MANDLLRDPYFSSSLFIAVIDTKARKLRDVIKIHCMPDDKKNIGKPDRDRVSLSEDHEVKYWSQKFAVSTAELVEAVKAVGERAVDVEQYLHKKKK